MPTISNVLEKTEKVIYLESSKIGVEHFARSSIEEHQEQNTSFHPTTFSPATSTRIPNKTLRYNEV